MNVKNLSLLLVMGLLFACTNEIPNNKPQGDDVNAKINQLKKNSSFVSEELAISVAGKFQHGKSTRSNGAEIQDIHVISDESNHPLMYVINYTNQKFVIISATKNYYPILAYSDENNLDVEAESFKNNEWLIETQHIIKHSSDLDKNTISQINFQWNDYEEKQKNTDATLVTQGSVEENQVLAARISELRDQYPDFYFRPLSRCSSYDFAYAGGDIYDNLCSLANQYGSPIEYTILGIKNIDKNQKVGPLLKTNWHQKAPYNELCPNKYPAGCVAIAMAQIMKFHQYPTRYNWNNIPNIDATYDTQKLIYDIGLAVDMDYGSDGSGSNINMAKKAFDGTFQYNTRLADFKDEEVKGEILNNNRPVYMKGSDNFLFFPKDGHAWVCDGCQVTGSETIYFLEYRSGTPGNYRYSCSGGPSVDYPGRTGTEGHSYHMNWGWKNGDGNGWFAYNNVKVNGYNFDHNRKNLFVNPR